MKKTAVLLALAFVLVSVVFVSGCEEKAPKDVLPTSEDKPTIDLSVEPTSIILEDDETTEDFVTATLTRKDENDFSAQIQLRVKSSAPGYIFPVDVDGKTDMYFESKPLKGKNSQDIIQFKVFGDKGDFETATGTLTLEMYWNNTKLKNTEEIEVSVE